MRSYPRAPILDEKLWRDPKRAPRVIALTPSISDAQYYHWEELRHRQPPAGADSLDWWYALKLKRSMSARSYPELQGFGGRSLTVSMIAAMDAQLALCDRKLAGEIAHQGAPLDAQTRDRYLSSALMEEAIHSSLFEGAVSTREIAKDMLRERRAPINQYERMIVNNHKAMLHLRELAMQPLTVDAVLNLHAILVDGTLKHPDQAGRIQSPTDERIVVWDQKSHSAVHTPPVAEELPQRLERLVAFANGEDIEGDRYTHPVLRSILLHFQLAFDHPFADGNGRTSRALFYWSMLRHGYWLAEFISISRLIYQRPDPYRRAFLYVESDPQDATYFVRHQLELIRSAIDELHGYVDRKRRELDTIRALARRRDDLNNRQLALLDHALRHKEATYTHESHANSHRISIMAARGDLQSLVAAKLLTQEKRSKKFVYRPVTGLEAKLKR
jgi:Fic family protein